MEALVRLDQGLEESPASADHHEDAPGVVLQKIYYYRSNCRSLHQIFPSVLLFVYTLAVYFQLNTPCYPGAGAPGGEDVCGQGTDR